jgi:hypothetical protein
MTDDFLYDSVESRQINPRTIGKSGSFVEDEMTESKPTKNTSF